MTDTTGKSIYRALTTVNAPLPWHIDARTLVSCLRGEIDDDRWAAHMRSFLTDVETDVMADMAIEGVVTMTDLRAGLERWRVEDCDNARWIREMAPVPLATSPRMDA